MNKRAQMESFENDLFNLCNRYLHEFDIDAANIMHCFVRTVANVLEDLVEEDFRKE